jgi:hypothetical protein
MLNYYVSRQRAPRWPAEALLAFLLLLIIPAGAMAATYTISGQVTVSGAGLNGVTVTATPGGLSGITTSSGAYTISGLAGSATYTLTPAMTGYSFSPASQSVSVTSSNQSNINFTATNVGGWDPLRQIAHQVQRPNLLLVQDVTGSMSSAASSTANEGVDGIGLPTLSWSNAYSSTRCSQDQHKWTYTLVLLRTNPPSRICNVKNALGAYVALYSTFDPPDPWPVNYNGWTYLGEDSNGNPQWQTTNCRGYQPGPPFSSAISLPDWTGSSPVPPQVGGVDCFPVAQAPQDLIGKTANQVNWGLSVFSTNYTSCNGSQGSLLVPIDSSDSGNVTAIENYLKPHWQGGLNVGGGTPTIGALDFAEMVMVATYRGGTAGGHTFTADPKAACGRPYGVILSTDGLSNTCNPNDGDWISPCGSCPGPNCCDAASSDYNCPSQYTLFDAGVAEFNWGTNLAGSGTAPQRLRTWVIGVSNQVSPCELNFVAYMGRTDASSPNGDAGYNAAMDYYMNGTTQMPYLPQAIGDTSHYYEDPGLNYSTTHNYAFFATNASSMANAIASIVAGAASGDYSTAAPVISTAISGGTDVAYIASASYPSWQGHFYAYDVHNPSSPVLDWDAGKMLALPWVDSNNVTRGRSLATNPRAIYTWDSAGNLVNLGDSTTYTNISKLPSTLTLPAGFSNNVLDFIRGFDGSLTSTQRSWILGPILDSTAAVLSAPDAWKQSQLPDHKNFEATYAARHPLVLVGSSDGMLHVFDVADGYEVYAILPPEQLANEVRLYDNYVNSGGRDVTGERKDLSAHVYGVASSPRFADVYLTSDSYHTLLLLTEGAGGTTVAAIDVTHSYPGRTNVYLPDGTKISSYPADANYDSAHPITIEWFEDATTLTGLGQTWSVPAAGATSSTSPYGFDAMMGSGYSSSSSYTPSAFALNLQNGTQSLTSGAMTNASSGALVNNQAYGAGVLFNVTDIVPKNYDLQNLGVLSDTNGRVWFVVPSSGSLVKAIDVGASQPIYYTPAIGYYSNKDILAFASGNFYETSPTVTGSSSTFVPKLYLVEKSADATAVTNFTTDVYSVNLTSIVTNYPDTGDTLNAGAQVTADPVLFIPSSAGRPVKAFFLVYDPSTSDCAGTSYLVEIDANVGTGWVSNVGKAIVTNLGSGVASGFAFSGGKILIAKSAVGSGQAQPVVGGTGPTPLGEAPALSSWTELT